MKFLVILCLLVGFNSVNAATLNQVTEISGKKISASAKSQQKIDKNVAATNKLLEEYRNLNHQIDGLKFYSNQLSQQIDSQQKIIDDVEYSMSRISTIERQLPALIQNMVSTLEQFVTLDAPFHLEERHQRVDQLKSNLTRADLSQAEKFRQVLEAYKIEIEYGRKIDSYEATIELNDQPRQVTILRVGRVALLYQTRDRLQSGLWDRKNNTWQSINNEEYRNAIVRGIRVAKNQSTIELLQLPIGQLENAE
ncbi:MAG: hypothetical protein ACI8XC_002853 [Gammaproteobacteria bacterium]|jgi:hypothetical protein